MLLSPHLRRKKAKSRQQGYVLIVMMLFFALLAISLTAAAPAMVQRIRRDREIELQHRGKQYIRAIRLYYRKFGRFPMKLEDLENTNNVRFLRRRYKDPMTPGGDWRLIHYGEAQLSASAPVLPGATPVSAMGGGGASAGVAGIGNSSAFASTFSLGSQTTSSAQNNAAAGFGSSTTTQTGATQTGSSESSQSGQSGQPGTPTSQLSSSLGGGPTFGGAPIVGVASTSKKPSIKLYNLKDHYNDWEFVYDPRLDLTTAQQIPGTANQLNATAPGAQISPGLGGLSSTPGMPSTSIQSTSPTH